MSDDEDLDYDDDDDYPYPDDDDDDILDDDDYALSGTSHDQNQNDIAQLLLEEDIDEAKEHGFYAGYDINSIECSCWIGFPLAGMRTDLLYACGLDPARSIAIKLVFTDPPVYGACCPNVKQKHVFIRQTSKKDFSKLVISECQHFGLWWTLEQRLSEYLSGHWTELAAAQEKMMQKLQERNSVASAPGIRSLMEIHAVPREVAILALKQSGNHLDCATELLFDEDKKNKLKAEVKKKRKSVTLDENTSNLLLLTLRYVKQRMEVSTRYCIVCDKPHPIQLLKPVVCSDDLCNFQFTNMGLGINVENEILRSPQACDLVIMMTTAASFSAKHFEPFPSVETSVTNAQGKVVKMSFDRSKPREVGEILQKCPSIHKMTDFTKKGILREELENIHPLLYKLLRWIIGTNRCELHYITDPSMRVEGVHTEHQFLLKSNPPEKERAFKQLKSDHHGSFHAFHGSGLGNWHSIIRKGLKNYSGTEKQSHGAVYGPGIYMAVDGATALGYAAHGNVGLGWQSSQFGASVKCIALCEVVNHGDPDLKKCQGKLHRPKCKHSTSSPHYRVEMEELVATRYLFLYSATVNLPNVLAKDLKIPSGAVTV